LRPCSASGKGGAGGTAVSDFALPAVGRLAPDGWDLVGNYRPPERGVCKVVVNWDNSYTSKYDSAAENSDGDPITVGGVGFGGVFRLRSNLGVNWEKGAFGANWNSRYYSGLKESCAPGRPCSNPDRIANGEPDAIRELGSNTFHDVQFYVKAPWNATVAVGANNVFDHVGPVVFTQPSSNFPYYGGFDIGRTIYVKYQQRYLSTAWCCCMPRHFVAVVFRGIVSSVDTKRLLVRPPIRFESPPTQYFRFSFDVFSPSIARTTIFF